MDRIRLPDGSHGSELTLATVCQQPRRRRYHGRTDGAGHEALGFLLECC